MGIRPRKISADEIVHRLVFSLVNEGAQIVDEGIAQRASDIDIVYIFGYGFPVPRGGPMLYADSVGLLSVSRRMQRFGWTPAPLIKKLAAAGKTFN
jgi:3-hydroxyacyl-CoA dehydrogenase